MKVLLARSELQTLPSPGYQKMAVKLLESGYECPALHDIAWDPVLPHSEAETLFASAASQLGISRPSRKEAFQILLRHYAEQIMQEECSPHVELEKLINEVYWPEASKDTFGSAYDMESFVRAYWCYDDLRDNPDVVGYNGLYGQEAHIAFDQDLRCIAANWLMNHSEPASHSATCETP